jgi:phosphatidate cytidylyltransferase
LAIDKNLIQRSIAGLVFLAIMISCICINHQTLSGLFMCLALLGSYEFVSLINTKINFKNGRFVALGFQAILCLFVFSSLNYFPQTLFVLPFYLAFLALSFVTLFLIKAENVQRIALVGAFMFSLIYVFLPFLVLTLIGFINNDNGVNFIVLYFFILIWVNDTMAYVTGRLMGKHKLAETISPKKTIEGFVGGIVFTTVASIIAGMYWENEFENPIMFWVAPLAVGVFGTIGDLFESSIKRWVGVKDSGNIIPGHGGILDRFDGALLAIWPYTALLLLLNR